MNLFYTATVAICLGLALNFYLQRNAGNSSLRSITYQSLHYFSRPHKQLGDNVFYEPVQNTNNSWNGTYMNANSYVWSEYLTKNDKESIIRAVSHFESLNKSLAELKIKDFPLTAELTAKIDRWRYEVGSKGRGFQVIKGVPVQKWNLTQTKIFYWAFGKYLGIPGAQDNSGEMIESVKDVGNNGKTQRQYKSNTEILYHCDAADVVGLLCIHPAKTGGYSRIISSISVYNRLLALPKGQEYAKRLHSSLLLDTRSTGGIKYVSIYPLRTDANNVTRTFYHQEYFRSAYRLYPTALGEMDPLTKEALDAYDRILDTETDLSLDMRLESGDIQLISNHFTLHSRTGYEDYTDEEINLSVKLHDECESNVGNNLLDENHRYCGASDINTTIKHQRHLLRLWVSLDEPYNSWELYISKQFSVLQSVGYFVQAMIFNK